MAQVPVGTWIASLTGAGVGIAVGVILIVAIHYNWVRRKLIDAVIWPVAISTILVAISVLLVNWALGHSWLRYFSVVGGIGVLAILLWERHQLPRRTS